MDKEILNEVTYIRMIRANFHYKKINKTLY